MASRFVAALTGACVALSSATAAAQSAPPASAAPPAVPAPPAAAPPGVPAPPAAAPPPVAWTAAPARTTGLVRVHFRTPKGRDVAKIYQRRGDGFIGVCSTPCTVDLHPAAQMRIVLGDHDDEPHDFALANEGRGEVGAGREVDVLVSRGGRGALAGGIVMTSIGGLGALVGLVLVAVSSGTKSSVASSLQTAGLVTLLIGGGLTIGGIVLIANRSAEPRVRLRDRSRASRGGGARGDVATASRTDLFGPEERAAAPLVVPAAVTPAGLTLHF